MQQLAAASAGVRLLEPETDSAHNASRPIEFTWLEIEPAALARLEVEADGQPVFGAVIRAGVGRYLTPPFFGPAQQGKVLRWRVVAVDATGGEQAASHWNLLRVE